jgi:hypothetical protein
MSVLSKLSYKFNVISVYKLNKPDIKYTDAEIYVKHNVWQKLKLRHR